MTQKHARVIFDSVAARIFADGVLITDETRNNVVLVRNDADPICRLNQLNY